MIWAPRGAARRMIMADEQKPEQQEEQQRVEDDEQQQEQQEEEDKEESPQSPPSKVAHVSSDESSAAAAGAVTTAVASPLVLGLGLGVSGAAVGEGKSPPGFTFMQLQEFHHQSLIFKHMVAAVPVPIHLILPIWKSVAASYGPHHYPSFVGLGNLCYDFRNSMEPEPGRCRRTDGKKWRCSRDVVPDQKYCERHMHRGRNRSRKHVEAAATVGTSSTAASPGSNTNTNLSITIADDDSPTNNNNNSTSGCNFNIHTSNNNASTARIIIGSSPASVVLASSNACKTGGS